MQPSVVPELALEQTATRPIHWVATATAIAAVVAGSSFVQTGDATAAQSEAGHTKAHAHTNSASGALPAPDPHGVTYPVECGPAKVLVQKSASGDLDGDGRPETVSVVHCDAGSGTPPNGVYVVTAAATAGAEPRIVATLVDPQDQYTVSDIAVHNATISATLLGYSSPDVPRCCPDQQQQDEWQWRDGAFQRSTKPLAHSS